MPWTTEDLPLAFKDLEGDDLGKALSVANAALEAEKSEDEAIKEALAALSHSEAVELDPADRLVPHGNGWAILSKNGGRVLSTYGFYHVAERKLKEFDKAGVS